MSDEKLHVLLTQVHEQLQQQDNLDSESRELLQQVLSDVKTVSGSENTNEVASDFSDLSDRIEKQALQFEHAHPTVAEILRQIMDTLGRIGV